MNFEHGATVIYATIFGATLAFPSFGLAAIPGRSAQSAPVYAQASGTVNPSSVDDATLKRTAAAYIKVHEIAAKAQQAISATDDPNQKQQLVAESESEKLDAVKKEGMQPQQYNNVIQMVEVDNSLKQKFLTYVQELKNS